MIDLKSRVLCIENNQSSGWSRNDNGCQGGLRSRPIANYIHPSSADDKYACLIYALIEQEKGKRKGESFLVENCGF